MNLRTRISKFLMIALVLGGVGASLGFAIPWMRNWLKPEPQEIKKEPSATAPRLLGTDVLSVPAELVQSLGIRTAPATVPTHYRGLSPLPGSLALDPNRMARVHARFPGEVIELGLTFEWSTTLPSLVLAMRQGWIDMLTSLTSARARPLAFGDVVAPGQLLAVVWNKDLVEKKWELVDALSQKRLEERTNARLEELVRQGAVPLARLEESRRTLAQSRAAVAKAELTLRAWRLTDQDLAEVYTEEEKLSQAGLKAQQQKRPLGWARVEVRSPLAGTILEKNIIPGDIVDTTTDLFKIADLSRLAVHAYLYEEDLPYLLKQQSAIAWNIQLKSDPSAQPLAGVVRKIGSLVDPTQHTILLTGEVNNSGGELRPGQFITAGIHLPPPTDEVEIPTAALLEDGEESLVLVQPDSDKFVYHLRRVNVVRRYKDVVTVARIGDAVSDRPGFLRLGERVVSSGALELRNLASTLNAR